MLKSDFRERLDAIAWDCTLRRNRLANSKVYDHGVRELDAEAVDSTIMLARDLLELCNDHLKLEYPDRHSVSLCNPYEFD